MAYAPPERPPLGQPEEPEDPPFLKRLRLLVMVLTVVLIIGIVTIAATIVIRLGVGVDETIPVAAASFELPPGEIKAVGRGDGSVLFVIVTPEGRQRLVVFDQRTGGPPASVTDLESAD